MAREFDIKVSWKVRSNEREVVERTERALRNALGDMGDFLEEQAVDNIHAMGIDDTGFLAGSSFVDKSELNRVTVGFAAEYAPYIDGGTQPHFPPVEPLILWARRKLRLSQQEAVRAGWSIARRIASRGTDPKPFFRNAVDSTKAAASRLVAARMAREGLG